MTVCARYETAFYSLQPSIHMCHHAEKAEAYAYGGGAPVKSILIQDWHMLTCFYFLSKGEYSRKIVSSGY